MAWAPIGVRFAPKGLPPKRHVELAALYVMAVWLGLGCAVPFETRSAFESWTTRRVLEYYQGFETKDWYRVKMLHLPEDRKRVWLRLVLEHRRLKKANIRVEYRRLDFLELGEDMATGKMLVLVEYPDGRREAWEETDIFYFGRRYLIRGVEVSRRELEVPDKTG